MLADYCKLFLLVRAGLHIIDAEVYGFHYCAPSGEGVETGMGGWSNAKYFWMNGCKMLWGFMGLLCLFQGTTGKKGELASVQCCSPHFHGHHLSHGLKNFSLLKPGTCLIA